MRKIKHFSKYLLPTVAATLIGLSVLVASPAKANVSLGVVRSPSNYDRWSQIATTLEATGISYQAIALEEINTPEDLKNIAVLFLPDVQTLSETQLQALQEWVKQGGRLIASGQVGRQSSARVRQGLRSLLGSYWAFPLNQPTIPEPQQRCLDIACQRTTSWLPLENVDVPPTASSPAGGQGSRQSSAVTVQGGVLIPAGLNSTTVATWKGNTGTSAAIATPQATYLGWHWGENTATDLDATWLQATFNRLIADFSPQRAGNSGGETTGAPVATQGQVVRSIEPKSELSIQPAIPIAQPPTSTSQQPTSRPEVTSLGSVIRELNDSDDSVAPPAESPCDGCARESVQKSDVPQITTENPTPTGPPTSNDGTNRTSPRRSRPSITDLLKTMPSRGRQNSEDNSDPSQRSAPPGLEIRPESKPITNAEAYAMVEELKNLLGRFENALIAAKSAREGDDNLRATVPSDSNTGSLIASNATQGSLIAEQSMGLTRDAAEAVVTAEQVIEEFPELVRSQKYDIAREKWLDARQLLWENYPTDGIRANGEIRAVWLDRGTIVRARSEQGLTKVFNQLAAAGINTVFFETMNAGYAIYPSNVAPKQNPLTLGWDPLAAAVKLARDRNMELHAWIWTFAVGNKHHNVVANQPEDYLGPVITAHPNWVMTDNKERKRHVNDGKTYMDPANPDVRNYLMRLIDEIASRYQVDGIHLDYIRYPFQDPGANFTHGYGQQSRQEFKKLHGVDPIEISPAGDRQMWWKWTEFRIGKINSFVGEVSQRLKRRYPDVILSAAVFPQPQHERLWKIQQEWETWAKEGYIDLLAPMTYALDTNRLQQLAQALTDRENLGNTLIAPGVKLLNISEIVAFDQIQALRDLSTGGYSIFAAERINGDFQKFLRRTQGPASAREMRQFSLAAMSDRAHTVEGAIPYREPFRAAAERFLGLKQEWSFLLSQEQLQIEKSELRRLRKRAKELGKALDRLADNPSSNRLTKARRLLAELQSQFEESMRSHAQERPYQVQTWENRLSALEMLLNYGDRVRLQSQRF